MNTEVIYEFLTKYNLANRVSCHAYITEIKLQKIRLTSDDLIQFVSKSKLNLQEDFNSNLQKTIDQLNFNINLKVKDPYNGNKEISLLDLMIFTTINADNQWILQYFDIEVSSL